MDSSSDDLPQAPDAVKEDAFKSGFPKEEAGATSSQVLQRYSTCIGIDLRKKIEGSKTNAGVPVVVDEQEDGEAKEA